MPVSELDADKNPLRGYVLGNEYISQSDGTSFGYYLNDEQGSVRYLTGSDGSIRNHYRYSAFGETITAEETVPNRLKYNAQMADELTGLYYLRARYYNASLGRFTQEDTIYNDGLNLYAYCNSNPVMYSDPSGFAKETCKSKVGGECDCESGTPSEKVKVPTVKSGEFNEWFNSLSVDELDELWKDKSTRKAIERQLRAPGGMHEWHLVSRAPQFKYWGVNAEQIRDLRTVINDVEFVNPVGKHGQLGSTTAHNELLGIIDSSSDYSMFTRRLNNWANYRLKGGIDTLPEGLRIK